MARRREPMDNRSGMVMVNGDGGSSFVSGEQLKQADVPVETMLGAVNGAISGGLLSSAASAAVTYGSGQKANIIKNITGTHLVGVLSGTAAFAALGAIVRNSRARKHNQWTERYYDYLEQQQNAKSHVEREDDRRNEPQVQPQGQGR